MIAVSHAANPAASAGLPHFVVIEANRGRRLRQVAGDQVAQHRAPRDEAIAMHLQVKSIGARRLIRIQYRAHASEALRCAVKAGEPQMNFAAFESYCVWRTVHAADDYTGIDRSYRYPAAAIFESPTASHADFIKASSFAAIVSTPGSTNNARWSP